jgi:hypothetical protein
MSTRLVPALSVFYGGMGSRRTRLRRLKLKIQALTSASELDTSRAANSMVERFFVETETEIHSPCYFSVTSPSSFDEA